MSIIIESDLKEILTRLENKIDEFRKDLSNFKEETRKEFSEIKVELAEIKIKVNNLEKDTTDLKGTQKAQIWAVISLLGIAVVSPVLRAFFAVIPGFQ